MRFLFFKSQKPQAKKVTAKVLAYLVAVCIAFSGISFASAGSFDDQTAKNGTGFTKVPDNEKTAFLLFFGTKENTTADGMQGRWKMLTKEQMESITDNSSARTVFNSALSLWQTDQKFSTWDGSTLTLYPDASGINIMNLAKTYGFPCGGDNKSRLEVVCQDGTTGGTDSWIFEKERYYFESLDAAGVPVLPLLKVDNGEFAIRVGQESIKQKTASQFKDNLKALQVDAVTTATQSADVNVVFTVKRGTTEEKYSLSEMIDAGEYDAVFAYYDNSGKQVTADVRGVRLSDVLVQRSIKPGSNYTTIAINDKGKATILKSSLSRYFLAYTGQEKKQNATTALTSNSEFCLFGPGKTISKAKIRSIYSLNIVQNPKATKITRLTKAGKRAIRVKWARKTGITGYQLKMATKRTGTYKIIKTIKSAKTTTYTKKKLKRGKKYFFKIRTYKTVNGKTLYSPWSTAKYKKL